MAVRLEWITTVSFFPSPNHMVPSLSHLFSVDKDNNTYHIFSFTCLRLVSNGCFCFVSVTTDRPWRFHVVICFNSFFLLPSLLFLCFSYLFERIDKNYLLNAVAQIFLSHSLPAWRPRVGVNFPQPHRRQTFCEIVGIASVGTIRTLSIQFVFRGVDGWLALRPLLIFH